MNKFLKGGITEASKQSGLSRYQIVRYAQEGIIDFLVPVRTTKKHRRTTWMVDVSKLKKYIKKLG